MMLSLVAVGLSIVLLVPATFGGLLDIHKGPIVHLFEWKWDDIARECEEFLGPKGFVGVQISPPTENLVANGRPWWERYQPISYKLESRSGSQEKLAQMVRRCNDKNVRIFADVVLNHMSGDRDGCKGVHGTHCDPKNRNYPGVPYSGHDFHWPACQIKNYQDANEVRKCELVGLHDLDQSKEYVRGKMIAFLNSLVAIGVAGFRVDAAKHMHPHDLKEIFYKVDNLNTAHGFAPNTRPFVYLEVLDAGGEAISYNEYTDIGLIANNRYSNKLSEFFKHGKQLASLHEFGSEYLVPDHLSVVYVENHDSEREEHIINYKKSRAYKMAVAFLLAYGRGTPLILSSFKFSGFDDGAPADKDGNIMSPEPGSDHVCANKNWLCQHRWRQIYSMVAFNRATHGLPVSSWWDNRGGQIAFTRGTMGFVAFNMDGQPLQKSLKTHLRPGRYCDVISGLRAGERCEGTMVQVSDEGYADIFIKEFNEHDHNSDGVLAIFDHEASRLPG